MLPIMHYTIAASTFLTVVCEYVYFGEAFTSHVLSLPSAYLREGGVRDYITSSSFHSSLHAGLLSPEPDEDDEEEEEEEDEDETYSSLRRTSSFSSSPNSFSNLKLDPWDPNPPIKPRPGRFGFTSLEDEAKTKILDTDLRQTMSQEERRENLKIMRQIKKNDLADLRLRKDHAGWVEANNDLKRREAADVWFRLNDCVRDAYQMGNDDEVKRLTALIDTLGGPPPDVKVNERGYAVYTDIYDVGISASRAASALDQSILEERVRRGRAMAAERAKNMEKEQREWENMMRNPGEREDKEASERRERTMRRLMSEIEEDNKKKEERAKEVLGQMPELPTDNMSSLAKAVKEAQADVKRLRKMRAEGLGLGEVSEDADLTFMNPEDELAVADAGKSVPSANMKSSASRAREAAAAEASGGRPRLPGDIDVTRGEISIPTESSSTRTTGPLTVVVTSSYNTEQSDPPMRKHCFQYTIRIKNNSGMDAVQLLSRRFEIQTVGSSMKDVVKGEGVTGRQPILKPGEEFEYTSTAPLSVRPIGTTIIAARMSGEYRYVILDNNQDTATPEQVELGGDSSAEMGMFHFIFPQEQRVKPIEASDNEDEEVPETVLDAASPKPTAPSSQKQKSPGNPASTLPGDIDMKSGDISSTLTDSSNVVTDGVRVQVSSAYRPERSDPTLDKHCFAYNVRITNESPDQSVQLVSRRFEIQTVGSETKDVVQGPGVTGRQPILKPGESFEYTSTAPLSVKPLSSKTNVVARMEGEYNFVMLGDEGNTPISSNPLQAKMGVFHFILP